MLPKDTYSAGPVKVLQISPHALVVHKALTWLEKRQNRDGSWGRGKALDKVIATCHALMALLACGYPSEHETIVKGINWLAEGEGSQHLWSFWRIGPMLKIPRYQKLVEHDLERIEELITKRTAPHPDQLLEIFAVKALRFMGKTRDDPKVQQYLRMVLHEWEEERAWRNRADTTSHALAVVAEFDFPRKEEIVSVSKRLIKLKASETGPDRLCWEGLRINTAYVIMNLIDSGLRNDGDLMPLLGKAVNWLVDGQQPSGNWIAETPPFGGTGDIISPDYYTAAIMRAITAFDCASNPNFPLEVMWLKYRELAKDRQRLVNYIRVSIISAFFMSALVVWNYRNAIAQATLSWLPQAWAILGILVPAIGILRTLVGWIRGRQQSESV